MSALAADLRAQHPERAGSLVKEVARAASDPSLHAVALIRAIGAAPPGVRGVLRRLLLAAHAIYVEDDVTAGPGLVLKHPVAVVLGRGATLGRDVWLFQGVTVHAGSNVGDGAKVFTGAVVRGRVGEGAQVGALAVVEDVAPGGVARAGRSDSAAGSRAIVENAAAGLLPTLRADHVARFGAEGGVLRAAVRDRGFRVVAMVRLRERGPKGLERVWRRALVAHGVDIGADTSIGAGFAVPVPVGVVVGRRSRLGAAVRLDEHTCVTPTRTTWDPDGPSIVVGASSHALPGASAFGGIAIADGSVLAPRALVTRDAAPGAVAPPAAAPSLDAAPGTLMGLLWGDVRRAGWRALAGVPFQAVVLLRLATVGPKGIASVARAALRAMHHIYVAPGAVVGPRVQLPRPMGIRIDGDVWVGADVTIGERVSLAAARVEDGAVLGSAVVALGAAVRGVVPDGTVVR